MAVMVVLVTVKYTFPVNVSVLFTRRMACSRVSASLRKNMDVDIQSLFGLHVT